MNRPQDMTRWEMEEDLRQRAHDGCDWDYQSTYDDPYAGTGMIEEGE